MRQLTYLLILIIGGLVSCNTTDNKNETIIEGINHTEVTTQIYDVVNGKLVPICMQKRADGKFYFKLNFDKAGIINLGEKGFARVFVKPGDHLRVELRDNKFLVDKGNCKENQLLSEWTETYKELKDTANNPLITYKEFFPFVESWLNSKEYKRIDAGDMDPDFIKLFNTIKKLDIESTLMRFLLTGHSVHPDMKKLPFFYDEIIEKDKFPDASIYQYDRGDNYLHCYLTYMFLKGKYNKKEDQHEQVMRQVSDDTLRSFLTLNYFKESGFQGLSLKLAADKFRKYLNLEDHKQYIDNALKSAGLNRVGKPGLNFRFPDINNVEVALSDLKGKIVVVDVWATWCGPCKGELPYLKELEEKYKGKDVTFVKISLDENKKAWEKYIKTKKPGGIQLHAKEAFNSDLAKEYQINAIPRFMVFDKEGKIVTVNAPRPSESILKDLIDSLL